MRFENVLQKLLTRKTVHNLCVLPSNFQNWRKVHCTITDFQEPKTLTYAGCAAVSLYDLLHNQFWGQVIWLHLEIGWPYTTESFPFQRCSRIAWPQKNPSTNSACVCCIASFRTGATLRTMTHAERLLWWETVSLITFIAHLSSTVEPKVTDAFPAVLPQAALTCFTFQE